MEQVTVEALSLHNPLHDPRPYKSQFQLNAAQYGYYWTTSPTAWRNFNGPIRSRSHAVEIARELNQAVQSSARYMQGGFSLFTLYPYSQHCPEPRTFDQQRLMNRFDYRDWMTRNLDQGRDAYVRNYIDRLLSTL